VDHVKNGSDDNFLQHCIPCIDVSPSMYNSGIMPLISAIGMGLMAMECSTIKRAFTFSEKPQWIAMNDEETFCQKVNHIRESQWGATTDIYAMFEMILVSCIEQNLSDEELGKYTLFIFSDMQFNDCSYKYVKNEQTMMQKITQLYNNHGYTHIPYVIFWNLRTTDNFPSIEKTQHCTKLSGNSAMLFKFFMNTNLETIKKMTNWTLLREMLNNPRYNIK
jgi:hypothetical protein